MIVVADVSVILNFLIVDRMDLLGRFRGHFLATSHVADEIVASEHKSRFDTAIIAGLLSVHDGDDAAEVSLFVRLRRAGGLSAGECAALAVAIYGGHRLAIEANRALPAALREAGISTPLTILRTTDIIASLVLGGGLSAGDGRSLKIRMGTHFGFVP